MRVIESTITEDGDESQMTIENTNESEATDGADIEVNDKIVETIKNDEATEYLKKLRAEARQAKARMKAMEAEHAEDRAKIEAEYNNKLAERENALKERHVMSELKAHAVKANILDIDVLKLMDRSAARFSADGELLNAGELIDAFRAEKPHLFSSATSVSTPMPRPKEPTSDGVLDWKNMSEAEKKARLRAMGITRR